MIEALEKNHLCQEINKLLSVQNVISLLTSPMAELLRVQDVHRLSNATWRNAQNVDMNFHWHSKVDIFQYQSFMPRLRFLVNLKFAMFISNRQALDLNSIHWLPKNYAHEACDKTSDPVTNFVRFFLPCQRFKAFSYF